MPRQALRRRFLSLAWGELTLTAALVFAGVYWHLWQSRGPFRGETTGAFVVLELLLLQGAAYWASWALRGRRARRRSIVTAFRALRTINLGVLLALGVTLVLKRLPEGFAVALAFFALVEYVNYFVIRLSFPLPDFVRPLARRNFPRSLLARELAEQRGT